jgi:prophage DNA circulation protein
MANDLSAPTADPDIIGVPGSPTILQLTSGIAWRQYLKRATFRDQPFYVETAVRESGRRVVGHEFPKREVPYAEDMGRRAIEFNVRGYLIVYPSEIATDPLKSRNYLIQRDRLIEALEEPAPAYLQLPLLGTLYVMCQRFRITEEERYGGFCTFDMTFFEYGQPPVTGTRDAASGVYYSAQALSVTAQGAISAGLNAAGATAPPPAFEE